MKRAGIQLDMFIQAPEQELIVEAKPLRKEPLRHGHVVAECGAPGFDYLLAYAQRRGVPVGQPSSSGKHERGKLVCLMVNADKKVVRASYNEAVIKNTKLRRLSPKRFQRLCDEFAAKTKGGKS